MPTHFHNAWTIVASALVASTVLKGIFDYCGTYLVNHAGFGMITNLRNDLYNSILRRSAAFFQKHTTGTLISTIINDIERVQFAMSTVLAEGLQQFFTFLFTAGLVIVLGRKLAGRCCCSSRSSFFQQSASDVACAPLLVPVKTNSPTCKISCTRPLLVTASLKPSAWNPGKSTDSARLRKVCFAQTCARLRRLLSVHP